MPTVIGGLFVAPEHPMTMRQMQHSKKVFLDHFAVYGNVSGAARQAGVVRSTVYRWQEHDDEFTAAYREAEIQATEALEEEARRRAVDGDTTETPIYGRGGTLLHTVVETKRSDTLLIFLLKARAPEKYRERFDVTTAGQPMLKEVADVAVDAVV